MGVRVRQKKKGKDKNGKEHPFWVFISHQGKRTSRKVGSKKAAQRVAQQIEAKLTLGKVEFAEKKAIPNFGEYAEKWLKGYVNLNCRESTVDQYAGALNFHIFPEFKNDRLDRITRGNIRHFLLEKHSGGLSRTRVIFLRAVFSGVFNYAIDEELIETNPASGISKRLFPKNTDAKKRIGKGDVFTDAELVALLDTCKTDFPEFYPFLLAACRTGMRVGELSALQWGDINFKNNYIHVGRSYRLGRFNSPKNGKARRVDMSGQLAEVLKETLKIGGFKDVKEIIFQHNGRVMAHFYISNIYKRILKRAGLRYRKFHSLRHSFCANLLSKGVSPYYVSRQVGHSSINITCDTYGSWIRTEDNRHVDLLDSPHPDAPQVRPEDENRENFQSYQVV